MMYLWVDTTIENDHYYFVANIIISKRALGSHNFYYALNRYYDRGLCQNYSPDMPDKPKLPWEFLE